MENIKLGCINYKGYEIKRQYYVDHKLREAYVVNGQIVYGLKAAKQLIDKLLQS